DELAATERNASAGYVYAASSRSLPGLVRVGVTRSPDPDGYVAALAGDALPDPYRAHTVVFADDAVTVAGQVHDLLAGAAVAAGFYRAAPGDVLAALQAAGVEPTVFREEP